MLAAVLYRVGEGGGHTSILTWESAKLQRMLAMLPWSVLGGLTRSGLCRERSGFHGPRTEAPRPLRHGNGSRSSLTGSTLLSYGSRKSGVYGFCLEVFLLVRYFSGSSRPAWRRCWGESR